MNLTLAEFQRRLVDLGAAGHQHSQYCAWCVPNPMGDAVCKCTETCKFEKCPAPLTRGDPVLYTEGFVRPRVPRFEEDQ